MSEQLECLNQSDGTCEGDVEYRESMTGTGTPMKRCHKHQADALERLAENRRRYPVHPPADFDPTYAGERWDEDY